MEAILTNLCWEKCDRVADSWCRCAHCDDGKKHVFLTAAFGSCVSAFQTFPPETAPFHPWLPLDPPPQKRTFPSLAPTLPPPRKRTFPSLAPALPPAYPAYEVSARSSRERIRRSASTNSCCTCQKHPHPKYTSIGDSAAGAAEAAAAASAATARTEGWMRVAVERAARVEVRADRRLVLLPPFGAGASAESGARRPRTREARSIEALVKVLEKSCLHRLITYRHTEVHSVDSASADVEEHFRLARAGISRGGRRSCGRRLPPLRGALP